MLKPSVSMPLLMLPPPPPPPPPPLLLLLLLLLHTRSRLRRCIDGVKIAGGRSDRRLKKDKKKSWPQRRRKPGLRRRLRRCLHKTGGSKTTVPTSRLTAITVRMAPRRTTRKTRTKKMQLCRHAKRHRVAQLPLVLVHQCFSSLQHLPR
jgi:hypothetical protein